MALATWHARTAWMVLVVVGLGSASGCQKPPALSKEEKEVVDTFFAFQHALKARDGNKLFDMLDFDCQAEADRVAKNIKDNYIRLSAQEKTVREKALGLSGTDYFNINAPILLKTDRFFNLYEGVVDGKLEKVEVQGKRAKASYVKIDEERSTLNLFRQDGQWRLTLEMPESQ